MAADNQTLGSDWRGWGLRAGLVSVMAATGMVLAGHAAQATPTVMEPPGTQADGDGEGLPLDLMRLAGGNSGATCVNSTLDTDVANIDVKTTISLDS